MRISILALIPALFILASSCVVIREVEITKPKTLMEMTEEELPLPPRIVHECRRTSLPIKVDGLREKAWDQAQVIDWFTVPQTATIPVSKTRGYMLWDDKAIYVFLDAKDRDVWSYLKKRDEMVCREDVLEIFIAYGKANEAIQYFNFEINTIPTIYDAYKSNRYHSQGTRPTFWDCPNVQVATNVRGTLNDPTDDDDGWSLEIAIPFDSIPWMKGRTLPIDGEEWSTHLARYDYSVFLNNGCELSSSTPFTKTNFHFVSQFQPLIFKTK